jgi:hypothetical protein
VKWKHKGDWGTKEFFKWTREKPKPSAITILRNSHGDIISDQHNLEQICYKYYKNLYSDLGQTPQPDLANDILNLLQPNLTPTMNATLGRRLITQELDQAARSMASEKTPGVDGISVEFYTHFWTLIGDEFTKMVNIAITRGTLVPGMTQGLITLIPKTGNRDDLGN